MRRPIPRRRFITVLAATAGLTATGLSPRNARAVPLHQWRGRALGAEASVLLAHPDGVAARRLLSAVRAEIERLERVFSLYRMDSAITALNREGVLDAPSQDLFVLLSRARALGDLTDGSFDPTVQPLWRLYADHFARPEADPAGPDAHAVARVRTLVDYRRIGITPSRIAFARRGMAMTLNGIAQGYITDRVADLLRAGGVDNVLVDIGEIRALGVHPDGRDWRVGLRGPQDRERLFDAIDLSNTALATSSGAGMTFDPSGRHHHLFDPISGQSADRFLSVSVKAADATTADALSTGFSAMELDRVRGITDGLESVQVRLLLKDQTVVTFGDAA